MTKKEKIKEIEKKYQDKIDEIIKAEKKPGSLMSYATRAKITDLKNACKEEVIKIQRKGQKPLTKKVLRVFDKNDGYSMQGTRYFLVLDNYDSEDLEFILNKISGMQWQNYNSYAIGTITDMYKDELYYSEIMNYNMYEINVDVDRIKDIKIFDL